MDHLFLETNVSVNSHVLSDELAAYKLDCNPMWDYLLGSLLIGCTLAGAPANALALRYFWTTRRMGDLTTRLYTAVWWALFISHFAYNLLLRKVIIVCFNYR